MILKVVLETLDAKHDDACRSATTVATQLVYCHSLIRKGHGQSLALPPVRDQPEERMYSAPI